MDPLFWQFCLRCETDTREDHIEFGICCRCLVEMPRAELCWLADKMAQIDKER